MLGFSYGEILLLLGATAALIGPKDLPIIARTAGRLAGRSIGYVQLARGQFESVVQQSQARQVHKELQDTMAQLDAIRHEIRSISIISPGPMTRRLVDNLDHISTSDDNRKLEDVEENNPIPTVTKDSTLLASDSCNMQSQATTYARLAESPAIKNGLSASGAEDEKIEDELQLTVIPVSAENTGLLPKNRGADVKGSDLVLEAILEAEVAHKAKEFFSQPQNQI
ncbi:PREDICTED: uncharacterized protein LOC109336120 [Lupinus angustifolius]|uniref:uncharacterized protein LOC109336120 n=1 Tax=Lupinus angustifolius TaxID=3871 RepID=UPI00092E3490|nr:PREDICTED: uncharacterized protein LOC109336120 [Lupinus angustifolius]XP_019428064.1 PREDICTED: uncharacterized protein LOC109336120 [Lupinus angustifolius]XP_019428065.1 PREDICTED: uncharacterized protein LOC109336120 [Lupinus angustifolius]XP_019428066.1 PREDICTED: uncharacterized protein LOC109336120 [Lupinus angustifolius]